MTPENIGKQLAAVGWKQGSLLLSPLIGSVPYLALTEDATDTHQESLARPLFWTSASHPMPTDASAIVITQTCDIYKSIEREPFVGVIAAYWSSDRSIIHSASKNSNRYFLLNRRSSANTGVEGFIADAALHTNIAKEHLLLLSPEEGFNSNDHNAIRKFRKWLGARLEREPLPDELVAAVQKPIVKALDRLKPHHQLHTILDRIDEFHFNVHQQGELLEIEILLIIDPQLHEPPSQEEDAMLVGWLDETLGSTDNARLVNCETYTTQDISAYDYFASYTLPLDYFTLIE